MLPHAQQDLKQLILAFADAHSEHFDVFDDIIQEKGRGVIMLLSGPPGVGKTLTADSVAEVMKVLLYVLSAGDLGTSASGVEGSLKTSFLPFQGGMLFSCLTKLMSSWKPVTQPIWNGTKSCLSS